MCAIGKTIRLNRLFNNQSQRMVLVPLDDSLLSGPEGGLLDISEKIEQIIRGGADAIMGFPGLFKTYFRQLVGTHTSGILNVTASTIRGQHTRKVLVSSVEQAIRLGMDAVGVHVNISSKYEPEMLKILGHVSRECERLGMPMMAIMYPRSEQGIDDYNYYDWLNEQPDKYAEIVRHAVRIGVELGADIIKTQFTGDEQSFRSVVDSSFGVPVVIAGGPMVSASEMLNKAYYAIKAGGAGVSFGRNVFHRDNSAIYIEALKKIVHEDFLPDDALRLLQR